MLMKGCYVGRYTINRKRVGINSGQIVFNKTYFRSEFINNGCHPAEYVIDGLLHIIILWSMFVLWGFRNIQCQTLAWSIISKS